MHIRPFLDADLPALVELTVETFRPLLVNHVRPTYGDELFELHHGRWQQDYRDKLATLDDPGTGGWIAVAEADGATVGSSPGPSTPPGATTGGSTCSRYRGRTGVRTAAGGFCEHALRGD